MKAIQALHESPLCSIWQSVRRLAIVGMGVFALGFHTVERRGREIGVRRVLGVSARSIVVLLTGEFTGLVLTASLVVCPLIYQAMNHWLDQFAYRQDPGLFVFFASGIAVLLVTWLTGGRSGAANRVA